MKINRFLFFFVVLGFALIKLAVAPNIEGVQAQTLFQPKITVESKEIPHNPNLAQQKANYPDVGNAVFFNNFAWQAFVALNWPANCQGQPLTDKKIGEAPDSPRVWEFYRIPPEVFLPKGKDPTTIQPTKPLACQDSKNISNVRLTETAKLAGEDQFGEVDKAASQSLLNDKGELTVGLQNLDAANEIPLVDRQGNYVINEIRLNPDELANIIQNKWYDADNLGKYDDKKSTFELVSSSNNRVGAIEVKAAWRVFDERNSSTEKGRYYTAKRRLLIPSATSATGKSFSQDVEVGLIGFHIIQKTGERGWLWSTFEQVDNVPNDTQIQGKYTLYDPNCSGDNCMPNTPYVREPYLWRQEAPHAVTKVGDEIENQIPSQIARFPVTKSSLDSKTSSQLKELTNQWQKALQGVSGSSAWQYYKLIGTEWLQEFALPYNPALRGITPARPPLANVALEPYVQQVSCIACHTSASLPNKAHADFSFLIDDARSSK
jgi:hypothetical protein